MAAREFEYIPYQHAAVESCFREWERGTDSTLLVLPTGCGKTVTAGMVAQQAMEVHGRRVLFLAHRDKLVNQAAIAMAECGLDATIEMSVQDALDLDRLSGKSEVVVGSVQSLQGDRLARWPRDRFGVIITDEAHHARAQSYRRIYEWFHGYWHLGITATPDRGDRKSIGSVFKSKCYEYPLRRAIQEGWLVPIVHKRVMVTVDLKGIRTTKGDLNSGDLAERIGPKIEELCDAIRNEIGQRQTVIFTPDVGSAMCVAQVLRDLGVQARYVAGDAGKFGMQKRERDRLLDEFQADKYQVIASCDLLTEGWDCPQTSCAVILRPTQQRHRYAQMVGRVVRRCPAKGKTDCLVLDFDWQADQDARNLCASIELFDDGSLDDEVLAAAKKKADGGRNLMEAIEEAEQEVRSKSALRIKLTGRKAKYRTVNYDPVGVGKLLDVKLKSRYDMDKSGVNPATPQQIEYLKTLGVRYPDGISKWGASKLISKLKKRRDQGLASVGQVHALLNSGVDEVLARVMSASEAARTLAQIQSQKSFLI